MPVLLSCAEARAIIEPLLPARQQDLPGPLLFTLEGMVEAGEGVVHQDSQVEAAANHIGNCPDCQAWLRLDDRYPERREWRERLAKYCCYEMLMAVNDPQNTVRFSSQLDRDHQPYWLLNDTSVVTFCPWCGTRLPRQPFEDETL